MPSVEDWMRLYDRSDHAGRVRIARALFEKDDTPVGLLAIVLADIHEPPVAFHILVRRLSHPDAVDWLLELLQQPGDFQRLAALEALGNVRSTRATEALLGLLDHSDYSVRKAAVSALGKIADPRSADALTARYAWANNEDVNIRMALEYALNRLGVVCDRHPLH